LFTHYELTNGLNNENFGKYTMHVEP